ncbi:universal stress protein A-like protein [Rutidosis leptorrhynchoides]|uniref:universal stress protein A-like protein n=1 Tax=Rutidosis leptorrhynchoides TaxID=125765 RepID=UPI003A999B8F
MEARKQEHRIVVAVDESDESMYALSWCLKNLLSQYTDNTTLVLLYVKPSPTVYSSLDTAGYAFSNDAVAAIRKYSSELVDSVMHRAEAIYSNYDDTNIRIERVVGCGDARDVICSTVDKLRADTLVMGSHGYGFIKRAILGSVSDHCAKNVKCPVVIVKRSKDN